MPGEFASAVDTPKPGANIRTMKSDVSEFLANTKPSLIKILSNQIEEERAMRKAAPTAESNYFGKVVAALVVIGSIGMMAAGGYVAFRWFKKPVEQTSNVLIPQSFFRTELSETIELKELEGGNFINKVMQLANIREAGNLMKRLVVLAENADSAKSLRSASASEFLKAADIRPTPALLNTLPGPMMPILHKSGSRTRLAVILFTSDANRARAELLRSENNLAFDWSPLFLDQRPEIKIIPYEDRTFRNISYRIAPFDAGNDLQLAYGVFTAKNYLIVASSEETFRAIIERLYEAN